MPIPQPRSQESASHLLQRSGNADMVLIFSGIRHQAAPCCPHNMCGLFHCFRDPLPFQIFFKCSSLVLHFEKTLEARACGELNIDSLQYTELFLLVSHPLIKDSERA